MTNLQYIILKLMILITYFKLAKCDWRQDASYLKEKPYGFCIIAALFDCGKRDSFECAKHEVDRNMWEIAGRPAADEQPRLDQYYKCMADKDCMAYTVLQFSKSLGKLDCNCDIKFDFADRIAIVKQADANCGSAEHLDNNSVKRFNSCAESSKLPDRIQASNSKCSVVVLR